MAGEQVKWNKFIVGSSTQHLNIFQERGFPTTCNIRSAYASFPRYIRTYMLIIYSTSRRNIFPFCAEEQHCLPDPQKKKIKLHAPKARSRAHIITEWHCFILSFVLSLRVCKSYLVYLSTYIASENLP
jgi:hypothetical protein